MRRAYPVWPRRRSYCVLQRVVNTVRFLRACLFATLVLPRGTFAERRRAVMSPTALPARPVAVASLQCRAQLLSLNKERPRTLAKTRPRVVCNRDRNVTGPPMAFADQDDFKHHLKRPDLDSSGGATGYVGRR